MGKNQCASCKYWAQGPSCSYCENPKQTDNGLKEYVYHDFSCGLFEKGECKQRIEWYNNLPQEKKDIFESMKNWPNEKWFQELTQK